MLISFLICLILVASSIFGKPYIKEDDKVWFSNKMNHWKDKISTDNATLAIQKIIKTAAKSLDSINLDDGKIVSSMTQKLAGEGLLPVTPRAQANIPPVVQNDTSLKSWQFDSRYLTFGLDFYGYDNDNVRYHFGPSEASATQQRLQDITRPPNMPRIAPIIPVNPLASNLTFFNYRRPSFLFFHGWAWGTTERMNKTTFNLGRNYTIFPSPYMIDVNLADYWRDQGWNIGRFSWESFADEPSVFTLDKKIFTREKMRYRLQAGDTQNFPLPFSVTDLATMELVSAFGKHSRKGFENEPRQNWPELRLCCTSAGCPLLIWMQYQILLRYGASSGSLAQRLVITDPWASNAKLCVVPFLCGDAVRNKWSGESVSDMLERAMLALKEAGVAIELHVTSRTCILAQYGLLGGSCLYGLRSISAFVRTYFYGPLFEMNYYNIFQKTTLSHIIAPEWYIRSKRYEPPKVTGGFNTLSDLAALLNAWNVTASHMSTYLKTVPRDCTWEERFLVAAEGQNFTFHLSPLLLEALIDLNGTNSLRPETTINNALVFELSKRYPTLSDRLIRAMARRINTISTPAISASTPTFVVRNLMGRKFKQYRGLKSRDISMAEYKLLK